MELLLDFRIVVALGPGIVNLGIETGLPGCTGQIDKTERQPATDDIDNTAAARGSNEKNLTLFQLKPALSSSLSQLRSICNQQF